MPLIPGRRCPPVGRFRAGALTAALLAAFMLPRAGLHDLAFAATKPAWSESDAVVVSVTESDLNRILRGTMRSRGGPVFEGRSDIPSKGITDLRYRVSVSDPVLKLGADGEATIALSILDGSLDIGKYQRRIGGRDAMCENLGVRVDASDPVDVTIALRLAIEDGSLKVLPERVSIPKARTAFRLVKPTRCEHAPLPRWFLWWIGKPQMKNRLGSIGDVLLASFKKSAGRLNEDGGLFGKQWTFGAQGERSEHPTVSPGSSLPAEAGARTAGPATAPGAAPETPAGTPAGASSGSSELYVRPGWIGTGDGRLLLSLTAADAPFQASDRASPPVALASEDRSFIAISQPFLNALTRYAYSRLSALPRKPGGDFAKLMKSDSVYSLVPGLRGREGRERISLSFTTGAPPTVELRTIASRGPDEPVPPGAPVGPNGPDGQTKERAMIAIHLSGLGIHLWQKSGTGPEAPNEQIGTLTIDSGSIGLVPYANPLGGISFEVVENAWSVSSSGVEFNEDLFEATIQEMVFAQVFQTACAPFLKDGLGVGDARLEPTAFRVVDGRLVIEFAGSDAEPALPAILRPDLPVEEPRAAAVR